MANFLEENLLLEKGVQAKRMIPKESQTDSNKGIEDVHKDNLHGF